MTRMYNHRTIRSMAWIGLAAVSFLSTPVRAETLHLNPDSTRVEIHLDSTFHQVEGRFDFLEGKVCFDPASGEAGGEVVIDSTSGSTHNKKRDKKMHRQVLESMLFPRIVFHPSRFDGTYHLEGSSELVLRGTIEVHGARHEVEIPTTVRTDRDMLTGTGRLTIPYVEWGMKDPSVFMFRAGKEVEIRLDLVGSLSPEPIDVGCADGARPRVRPAASGRTGRDR